MLIEHWSTNARKAFFDNGGTVTVELKAGDTDFTPSSQWCAVQLVHYQGRSDIVGEAGRAGADLDAPRHRLLRTLVRLADIPGATAQYRHVQGMCEVELHIP